MSGESEFVNYGEASKDERLMRAKEDVDGAKGFVLIFLPKNSKDGKPHIISEVSELRGVEEVGLFAWGKEWLAMKLRLSENDMKEL